MDFMGRMAFYIGLAISLIAGWIEVGRTGLLVLVVLRKDSISFLFFQNN